MMKLSNKAAIFLLVVLCSAKSFAGESVRILLNWKAEPEFGGFYTALLEGFYKKEDLDVEIVEGGSGTPTVQMLANKKADFAIVSADEIIISQDRNKKNKVKALYAVYQTSPYVIMTHAEKNYKSLQQVFNSSGILSVQAGLPFYPYLVKKFGKPKAQVVPYSGGVSNFLKDPNLAQQGFMTTEPLAAEKGGAQVKSFLIAEEGFNPYLVVLATHDEFLNRKPGLVEKIVRATRLGWSSYLKDPSRANKHMAGLNKSLDLETFNKAAEIQKPLIQPKDHELGYMEASRWTNLVKQLHLLGLIRSKPAAQDLMR